MHAAMNLHVERGGRGPDLVLLHGWGLHSGAWREAASGLHERFTVHAFDLPGHGRSAAVVPSTLDEAAAAIERKLPPEAIVCGWSLGGLLAQRIAQRRRAALRALVLASSTPCFVQRPDWPHAMMPATLEEFARGLAHDRDGTLRRFVQLNALHGARGREAVRAFVTRLAEHPAPAAADLQRTLAWLRDTDLRAEARDIACPTLVVHGARDSLAPIEAGRWLAKHIRDARLVEIEDAAHLPFFTHREAFVGALETFLA
jgi:pimeloyl-[acyl-carrier protein] methyl ester esterase